MLSPALTGATKTFRFIWNHPLCETHRAAALGRWVSWQVTSRIATGPIAVPFVESTRLLVSRGMAGATGNIYVGLAEFSDMALALHLLRPEDTFVDVGANIGSYTVLASGVVGARTLAFEPVPDTLRILETNLAMNHLRDRVTVHAAAVGDHLGTVAITRTHDTVNHIVQNHSASTSPTVDVPLITLDHALGGVTPALIKVDTEGFEAFVLDGAREVLTRPDLLCIMLELGAEGERYGKPAHAVFSEMKAQGFLPFRYDPFSRALTEISSPNTTGNTCFTRHPEAVRERVLHARQFRILRELI